MTENNHQPLPGDRLDRAAAAVRGEATPAPPADLPAAVLAAVHSRQAVADAAHAARRRRRAWVMRGISAGGLAACLAVAAGVLWGGGRADAAEALRRAVDNQGKAKSWRAVTKTTTTDPATGRPEVDEQTVTVQGGVTRLETGDLVIVSAGNQALALDRKEKTAYRAGDGAAPAGLKEAAAGAVKLSRLLDRAANPEAVPAAEIGGNKRPGYRVRGVPLGRGQTADATVYVDAERDLPVRLELTVAGPDGFASVTDFGRYGEAFDPALFRLEVPAGYTLEGDAPKPSPDKTQHVSLKLAAEAVAAAPAVVVTNTQRLRADGPELTVRFLLRPQQMRLEFPNPGTNGLPDPKALPTLSAIVFDAQSDKALHLNFGEKTAKLERRPRREVPDLVAAFRDLKDADGEPAGEEKVGGVTARVFRLKKDGFLGVSGPDVQTTVWLDPATSRPVKVRVTDGRVDLRFDNFQWPDNLAEGLFSLQPPDGFAVGEFAAPSPERTHAVSLKVALDNEAKSKSFRAVIKTTLANAPAGMPALPEQRLFGQGNKFRMEAGDLVSVTDGTRLVLFDTKAKTARTATVAAVGGSDTARGVAAGVRKLLDAQEGKGPVAAVPAVEIGGQKRPGFKVAGVSFTPGQTADVTYWLDEGRNLPLRWEVVTGGPVKATAVGEYLGFDEELDPKLFDPSIPAGYTAEELKLPAAPPPATAPPPKVAVPEKL